MEEIVSQEKIIQVFYIQYLIRLPEKKINVLIDSSRKVNTMPPSYADNLRLCIRKINIRV